MNIYAVADLHGRADLLSAVIKQVELHAGAAGGIFVCLGDFTSRGPDSRLNIERLIAGPALANWRWIILQGNHEAMLLESIATLRTRKLWWKYGGRETLASYDISWTAEELDEADMSLVLPKKHVDWLNGLPVYYEDCHRIFVHAGVPSDQLPEHAGKADLQWMLYEGLEDVEGVTYHEDREHLSAKHIVHGHHESANNPLLLPHRTNLDGLAVRTSRAAVAVFDEDVPGGPIEILIVTAEKS